MSKKTKEPLNIAEIEEHSEEDFLQEINALDAFMNSVRYVGEIRDWRTLPEDPDDDADE
jgi:hypothetical protein